VITILADHDIEDHADLLWRTIVSRGWQELASLRLARITDLGLPANTPDRFVWRFAQEHGMFLLTNNRNSRGPDSLQRTIREESTAASLPVLTIGSVDGLSDPEYRVRCAERLVEVVLYVERYMGTGRIHPVVASRP
jgi:hypothetical protein